MEDRRKDQRGPAEIEIHYRTAQEFLSAYAQNISGGGIFIQTAKPLDLNEEVLLRFTLPGIAHQFNIPGLVVWSTPIIRASSTGIGVKFMKVAPLEAKMIEEFVKQVLAQGTEHKRA